MASDKTVLVREVGLRDGLQIIRPILPTADKQRWLAGTAAAGFREIEITSLVPQSRIPQFFDAGEMAAFANTLPAVTASALIPNMKGAERGIELGIAKLTYIVSVSERFNLANVRRSREDSLADLEQIMALRASLPPERRPLIVGGVSSAFGCTLEGRVPEREIVFVAERMLSLGVDELVLADTTGYGDPAWVRTVLRAVQALSPTVPVGVHLHDTRGTGLANALTALENGIRLFDASLGGLGGCPNSPGATGNIATEDLVYMLEAMGFDTGIDLDRLINLRREIPKLLPDIPFYGNLSRSGLPTGFKAKTFA